MALPLPPGLTPNEVGFLCEMETVTVIPRQRLQSLELLGGTTKTLNPPIPAPLPLWLALLLRKQKRANILPPPWLRVASLTAILDFETDDRTAGVLSPPPPPTPAHPAGISSAHEPYLSRDSHEVSVPFTENSATAQAAPDALPYHWLEMGHLLLAQAGEDFGDEADEVRRLLRDLREVRMSKLRKGMRVLGPGAGVKMNGVGGMEVAEVRGFVGGMVDGLRRIGRAREEGRREVEGEGGREEEDEDDDMQL